jgi:hypothetical protein
MDKKLVYIISCMRSGSTLLKALMATRPDCSDLPEMPFGVSVGFEDESEILVFKKPAYYTDFDYPVIPVTHSKKIIIIRNPYDTIVSLQKMNLHKKNPNLQLNDELFLLSYWCIIYKGIYDKILLGPNDYLLIRYDDLVKNPMEVSSEIFKYIGSVETTGIDTYQAPKNYTWRWGSDDGGEVIKSLKVNHIEYPRKNKKLCRLIDSNEEVQFILSAYGFNLSL